MPDIWVPLNLILCVELLDTNTSIKCTEKMWKVQDIPRNTVTFPVFYPFQYPWQSILLLINFPRGLTLSSKSQVEMNLRNIPTSSIHTKSKTMQQNTLQSYQLTMFMNNGFNAAPWQTEYSTGFPKGKTPSFPDQVEAILDDIVNSPRLGCKQGIASKGNVIVISSLADRSISSFCKGESGEQTVNV